MSNTPLGPGWWQASDGLWYAPEHHPDARTAAPPPAAAAPPPGAPGFGGPGVPPGSTPVVNARSRRASVAVAAVVLVALAAVGAWLLFLSGGDDTVALSERVVDFGPDRVLFDPPDGSFVFTSGMVGESTYVAGTVERGGDFSAVVWIEQDDGTWTEVTSSGGDGDIYGLVDFAGRRLAYGVSFGDGGDEPYLAEVDGSRLRSLDASGALSGTGFIDAAVADGDMLRVFVTDRDRSETVVLETADLEDWDTVAVAGLQLGDERAEVWHASAGEGLVLVSGFDRPFDSDAGARALTVWRSVDGETFEGTRPPGGDVALIDRASSAGPIGSTDGGWFTFVAAFEGDDVAVFQAYGSDDGTAWFRLDAPSASTLGTRQPIGIVGDRLLLFDPTGPTVSAMELTID